ncbi:MAG TPA: tetraacyldisaccharide 4'-kinase, partial [Thermoanaerobaculia bacterium]|nr:tetraacyldisaccharide 4'-kinase [Thermoanaerobaculia bacterium]
MTFLAPLAALYGAAVSARLAAYRHGLLRVRRAGRPVLSVGNLAAGGTGKTPFVRWLAGELLGRQIRPSVLTRGYGRSARGAVVVSDGAGAVAPVRDSGDEAAVLARALPRVPIVADRDRVAAARRVEALVPDVALHLL